MSKKQFFLFSLVALFSFVGCKQEKKATNMVQFVKTDVVLDYGSEGGILVPGKVEAAEDANIAFRVPGTILRFYANQGSYVRKGQLLAELDSRDYRTQLKATEAEYKQVKAEAERIIALYKDNSTTENNYDKAQYGLQQITAKYENHKNQLADTKIYAPFSGYVEKRLFEEHETVGAGMPVISIINKDAPEVEINVPASTYMLRDKMQSFSCTFDVFPGEVFPLTLISVNQKANANQLYTMRFKLADLEGKKPVAGMSTMVSIRTHEDSHNVTVKNTAVFTENGKCFVYVLNKDVLKKTEVTVGLLLSNGRFTITSGLKAGDVVVATGVHHVKDGQQVKPLPATTSSNVGGLL